MTLATTTSRISYSGNDSTGPFTFPFRIFTGSDLLVTKRSADGAESTLTYIDEYSVTGAGSSGGTIKLVAPLAIGETLTIRRVMHVTQDTAIADNGAALPAMIEDELDRLVMIHQQHDDALARSLRLSETFDPSVYDMTLRELTAGKVVTGTGTGLTMSTLDSTNAVALPGAGRTVPSLSAYLANNAVFNFKDYGAIGDGVTDDTTAIQNCLNAAGSVHAGLPVMRGASCYLPPGTYKLTRQITVPPFVSISGAGGQASIFAPVAGIDAFNFAVGTDVNDVLIADFGIVGAPSTTNTAIKCLGTVNASDWHTGIHFHRLRITDFQTAFRCRTLHQSTIRECWIQRVNVAVDFRGQNRTNWLERNTFVYAGGCGSGVVTGIRIDGTADYNPGGKTLQIPESVHVKGNLIFGFQEAIDVPLATYVNIVDNDMNATRTIIQFSTVNGVLNIKDNYAEGGAAVGIQAQGLSSIVNTKINIEGNHLIGTGGANSRLGIAVNVFGRNQNQTQMSIVRNSFSGWRINDINVANGGDINVEDNHCFSGSARNNSIIVQGTLPGKTISIDKNRCTGNIFVAAKGNLGQVLVGANWGAFATLIRGTSTIPQGRTSVTTTYASLNGSTPNMDTIINTGLKPVLFLGTPETALGSVSGKATATEVVINCTLAPGTGGAVIPWEVRSYQLNI